MVRNWGQAKVGITVVGGQYQKVEQAKSERILEEKIMERKGRKGGR